MTAHLTISEWKELRRNSLVGFCTVKMPSGMIFHDVSVHTSNGQWWASPSSKPMIGKDGTALKDDAGKLKYSPVVSFDSKATRDRFSATVIEALRLAHPEAFHDA